MENNENDAEQVLAVGGTASNLYVFVNQGPGSGTPIKQWTFTVFKNGVATLVSCPISGISTSCADVLNTVTFVAGDRVSIQVTAVNSPMNNTTGSWSLRYQ